jgi:hypothetical protein
VSAGLLTLAAALAAPTPVGLQKGDEFTFVGTVAEAVERPGRRLRRNHELVLRVFVLDRTETWADAAVLTRLTRAGDAVAGAAGALTGAAADKDAPPAVRIDLVRVHADGTVHVLAPPGPPPLKLAADTPARAPPPVPLDTFPAAEFGAFPPRPPRSAADGGPWTVAAPANRPAETWQAKDYHFVNAERCQLLVMNQMSADWLAPVGGQTAWHRADAVWVSTLDGTARRVHRVIRQRDGNAEPPAAWVEVKYELREQTRLAGRGYDRARLDVEVAVAAQADAAVLVPDARRLGPKPFEARVARLDVHLGETDPGTPYREAILAARRLLDAARRGEAAPVRGVPAVPIPPPTRPRWPEPGQPAPDFRTGAFRLADHAGKPVVLVFFRPGGETAEPALAIADALRNRYAGTATVIALAVFADAAAGVKDRDRLELAIPVYDGTAAAELYGVETAPRFALIDAGGKVVWTFTGVGAETGFLVKEEADRLVSPPSPAGPTGTSVAPGPAMPPPPPRR